MIAHYNARPTQLDTADNSTHTIKVPPTPSPSPSSSPVPSSSPNPYPHPTQTSVPMGTSAIKRAKAKAKAKARAKINATEMCDEAPPLKDMLLAAKKSVTSRDWLMLSSSLPPIKTVQAGMAGDGRSRRDIETEVPADPVAALCIIHSIVAPLVLRDTEHLKVLMQLKSYSSHTQSDSSSCSSSSEGQGLEEIKSSCTVLTASVVRAVCGEKGVQDELTVSLLMTYCFLCAALMHHLKATGGVKRNAVDTDDATDSR